MAIIRNNHEPITEWMVIRKIAGFDYRHRNYLFPNIHLFKGEIDLAAVTPRMYLTEYEIKLTKADWRADERKTKWDNPERRKYVDKFVYVVPESLVSDIPQFVTPETGIMVIKGSGYLEEYRTAKKTGEKITPDMFSKMLVSVYHRFWDTRVELDAQKAEIKRLYKREAPNE